MDNFENNLYEKPDIFQAINFSQFKGVLCIQLIGLAISFTILIFEHLIYYWKSIYISIIQISFYMIGCYFKWKNYINNL